MTRERVSFLALCAAAAVSLGVAAGPVASRLSSGSGDTPRPAQSAARNVPQTLPGIEAVALIRDLAPFGRPPADINAASPPRETELALILKGVFIDPTGASSRAWVGAPDLPADRYAIGQALPTGAILRAIEASHIVLEVAGSLQRLSFPDRSPPGASPVTRNEPPPEQRQPAGTSALARLVPQGPVQYGQPEEAAPEDAASMIARIRDSVRRNPSSLLARLGMEATAEGYRVKERTSRAAIRAGLRPGDVITRINGMVLGDVQRDAELFDTILDAGLARIDVDRGGRQMTLAFPLQ